MDSKEQRLLKKALKDFPQIVSQKKKIFKKKQKILRGFDQLSKKLLKENAKPTQTGK